MQVIKEGFNMSYFEETGNVLAGIAAVITRITRTEMFLPSLNIHVQKLRPDPAFGPCRFKTQFN